MPTNYVFQPQTHFLEMAHTNFVSSIRKKKQQHTSLWFELKITEDKIKSKFQTFMF